MSPTTTMMVSPERAQQVRTANARYRLTEKGKAYAASANAKRYARGRALVDSAKDVPCMDCGVRYPPYVMDFDHRDPSVKFLGVGMMTHRSPAKIIEEIAKCDVVCSNCHRIRTHGGK